jgi:hypothetical protein
MPAQKVSDEYKFILRIQHSEADGGETQTLYRHEATGIGLIISEKGSLVVKTVIPPEMIAVIQSRF